MATIRIFETEEVLRLDFYEGHNTRLILTANMNDNQAHLLKDLLETHTTDVKATIHH